MNKIAFLLAFCYALNAEAQTNNCSLELIRDIITYIHPVSTDDTCYHYSSLLVMEVNKKSKLSNLRFSDNATEWMTEQLKLFKEKKFRTDEANKLLKANKLKNITLVFPVTWVLTSRCAPSRFEYYPSDDKRYFTVNGKLLTGNIQFCKPEVIGIHQVH